MTELGEISERTVPNDNLCTIGFRYAARNRTYQRMLALRE
jgi:hypothetical protein